MKRAALILLCLLFTVTGLPAQSPEGSAFSPAPGSVSPVEILYVPREDLSRAPGYEKEGAFLPLGEILNLVARAQAHPRSIPQDRGGLTLPQIRLRGTFDTSATQVSAAVLNLSGEIDYEARETDWAAVAVDTGGIPWVAQATSVSHAVALARVQGQTYLFCKGPAQGTLAVQAHVVAPGATTRQTFDLGRFHAPCRIELELGPEARLVEATEPYFLEKGSGGGEESARLVLLPTQRIPVTVQIDRRVSIQAPSSLWVSLQRRIAVRSGGLEVFDRLTLRDRFQPAIALESPVPAGLELLNCQASPSVEVEVREGKLRLIPREALQTVTVETTFSARLEDKKTLLSPWKFPAYSEHAEIQLLDSSEEAVVLREDVETGSSTLLLASARTPRVHYQCWGALPPVHVEVVSKRRIQPPVVQARYSLHRNEAELHHTIFLQGETRTGLSLTLPDGWVSKEIRAFREQDELPLNAVRTQGNDWQLTWDPARIPNRIEWSLRRSGVWGGPEVETRLDFPLLKFPEGRPSRYEIHLSCASALDVRMENLVDLTILPAGMGRENLFSNLAPVNSNGHELGIPINALAADGPVASDRNIQMQQRALPQVPPGSLPSQGLERSTGNLIFRVQGGRPSGTLVVTGRPADVQATVVEALSMDEDQAKVRALIQFQVRFAPVNSFQFLLPVGTERMVRISGDDLREQNCEPTPEGDLWTITPQKQRTGEYAFTVEWSLSGFPSTDALQAPEIRIPRVSSQRGFLLLEGSETLELEMKTSGLTEADVAELPPLPWTSPHRILAVYRYVAPPFDLTVRTKKHPASPAMVALVSEGNLTTALDHLGMRVTQAEYTVLPTSNPQFFEVRLPRNASVWSVLVDGVGVKPARRSDSEEEKSVLLVPLPVARADARPFQVSLIYREDSPPLDKSSRLELNGPVLPVPVNKSSWKLYLPQGFEYLAFDAGVGKFLPEAVPMVRFLREADYPRKILFPEYELSEILNYLPITITCCLLLWVVYLVFRNRKRKRERELQTVGGGEVGDAVLSTRAEGLTIGSEGREVSESTKAQSATPLPPASVNHGCLSRILPGIVILIVIAVLAMIATPNFLEGQTRAKLSRAQGDLRTMTTALESYSLDNKGLPEKIETLWQGPVSYLNAAPTDLFAPRGNLSFRNYDENTRLRYLSGEEAYRNALSAGLLAPGSEKEIKDFYLLYSVGPDEVDDRGMIQYDATNGTVSRGDVIRVGGGFSLFNKPGLPEDGKERALAARRSPESKSVERVSGGGAAGAFLYDTTNGTVSAGDVYFGVGNEGRRKQDMELADAPALASPAVVPPPPAALRPQSEVASQERPVMMADKDGEEESPQEVSERRMFSTNAPADSNRASRGRDMKWNSDLEGGLQGPGTVDHLAMVQATSGAVGELSQKLSEGIGVAVQRQRGLLSLSINLPAAGAPKTFSLPGTMESVKVCLMAEEAFLSVRFAIWALTSLLLGALWVLKRRAYVPVFLFFFGFVLIVPVVCNTTWVVFYNTAFKGILTSLFAPLLSYLLRGWDSIHATRTPFSFLLLLSLLVPWGSGSVSAEEPLPSVPPVEKGDVPVLPPVSDPAIRILVPYDSEKIPALEVLRDQPDPASLAFMSKSLFSRLWRVAESAETPPALAVETPILASLEITTTLDPDQSLVRGSFRLLAANRSNAPATRKLLMPTLLLGQWQASAPGAILDTSPSGLVLHLEPRWYGTVSAEFTLPCRILGGGGTMELFLPEVLGVWQFTLPYPTAQVDSIEKSGGKNSVWLVERRAGATVFKTALQPGLCVLNWTSAHSGGNISRHGDGIETACKADIRTTWKWSHLAAAEWSADLDLAPLEPGGMLPQRVVLKLPSGVHLYDAQGDALRKVSVESGDAQSSPSHQVVLELTATPSANFHLTGVAFHDTASAEWIVSPFSPLGNIRATSRLTLELDSSISILASGVTGLERQPGSIGSDRSVVQNYLSTEADWLVRLTLAPSRTEYKAEVAHFAVPLDGFLRQAVQVRLTPVKNALRSCWFDVPIQTRVSALDGERPCDWFQHGNRVHVTFASPLEGAATLNLFATAEITTATQIDLGMFVPTGAVEVHQTAIVSVPSDRELVEVTLNGATHRPLRGDETALAKKLLPLAEFPEGTLRAYERADAKPLRLGLRPIPASVLSQVHNIVTLSEGLQRTDSCVVLEPRKGAVQKIELFLLLPRPDSGVASRLQTQGPVRLVTTHPVSDRLLRVDVELDRPRAEAFQIGLSVDQPVPPEESESASALIFEPVLPEGSRTFLVLRRDFEGDLSLQAGERAQALDISKIVWPGPLKGAQPSDKSYELLGQLRSSPRLRIERYARTEALRAVVELVRQRTLVRQDGLERHELRIVLQNHSEQFLPVALPYPPQQVTIYQTLVAGRAVKTTLVEEKDRTILLVPLIRTGLLEPELAVRVAYTAQTGVPVEKSGKRQQRVAEIQGGIPVAQSVLELMLPPAFDYEDFKGSLKPVDLVDIETEELLRQSRRVEQLSEMLLQKQDEQTKMKALPKLLSLQQSLSSRSSTQKRMNEAYNVQVGAQKGGLAKFGRDVAVQQESLARERQEAMSEAEEAVAQLGRNVQTLNEIVTLPPPGDMSAMPQQAVSPAPMPPPAEVEEPETPPVTFPAIGDTVFAFRTLQGAGNVTFSFSDRESMRKRWDGMFALIATALTFVIALCLPAILVNTHRLVLALMALSVLAILFRFGLDLAIPLFGVLLVIERFQRKRTPASRP